MLTLNVAIGSSVSIGDNTTVSVKSLDSLSGSAEFAVSGDGPDRLMELTKGTTTQVLPLVMMHFKKVLHGSQPMLRLGFDAPRHINIDNNSGRAPKVDFKTMSTSDLIDHSKRWSRSAMEDELRNRLEYWESENYGR